MNERVVIIGAGFGGIGMAVNLLRAGVTDLTVLDAADGVGGVWRHNTYPGAGCDVPSHLYSFSFFPKADWERRYARQPEILDYLEATVRRFGIDRFLRLSTEVATLTFDEAAQIWRLTTSVGEEIEADIVISAVGQLNQPATPPLPGIDTFAGKAFHSARWRHDVDLAGKRVGVIGTGASAIQFVPEVAEVAEHTTVFQRSAPYIIDKNDRPFSATARQRWAQHDRLLAASRLVEYVSHESRAVAFVVAPALLRMTSKVWQRRLADAVSDPSLRQALTPDYAMGCKRLLLSNDWYDVMQRPDVSLVTDPIREVVADGVVTREGTVHHCDVLVYGTGFAASDFLTPMTVTGRGGRDLHEQWADGASAYLGLTVSGFPNLFLIYGPQTNLSHSSIIYMLESQMRYIISAIQLRRDHRLAALDVRPDVQSRWDASIRKLSARTVWESGCRSWYTTPDGRNVNNWPGFTFDYRRRTRHVDLADYRTTSARPAVVR